jgi:mannose-6-phosphate isomerase-like protein (cupin superfamily)
MTINATVLQPGEGQAIWQLGNRFTLKAAGEETQGRFAILEQVCAGAPPPMHVHENEEEAFYLLAGSVDLYLGDEVHHVEAGAFCLIPRGTPHSFTSTSAEPARMLVVVSPTGFEEFFAEVERQFPEANGMPAPEQVGPALNELANEYGLQIVGPPPQ